ncbi:MAG: serine/threonine-protein kinase PknK [Isosphaeraceae bacterium]
MEQRPDGTTVSANMASDTATAGPLDIRLSNLLVRWEELIKNGHDASAEELCGDCPELVEALRAQIIALREMRRMFGLDRAAPGSTRTGPASPVCAPPAAPQPADFELLGELGQGGMGVVYRAFDRNRREVVALKTMQWLDPATLDLFKKEFRATADLAHPNLVALHELVWDGRIWFFTMELVEGVDFLSFVRFGEHGTPRTTEVAAVPSGPAPALAATMQYDDRHSTIPALTPTQVGRLRAALGQLGEGLSALHAAGKLHRDIKPSNVLVRRDGRTVLLDFGLAADLGPSGLHQSTGRVVRGTLAYMSPEQAAGEPLSPASDWYSVGVMLYQALTGRLPSDGHALPFAAALDQPLVPPAARAPGTPEDLDRLCVDLLGRDPAARPAGPEIFRRLGLGRAAEPAPVAGPAGSGAGPWTGREQHLAILDQKWSAVRNGRTVVVRVHGSSGVGKSALVQRFLDGLVAQGQAVVLSGRCFERESVPYKALDSLIDALAGYLRHLARHDALALLPRDVLSLTRVFPALLRVEAIADAPHREFDVPDQQELRRRAFAALRELLSRLGDRLALVLMIDDLQWGDVDSAAALGELLRGPDPPVLLLCACHRDEHVLASPFLRSFLALGDRADPAIDWCDLPVGPLSPAESRALALALFGGDGTALSARCDAIARESGGNPFFVAELVRSTQTVADLPREPSSTGDHTLTLDAVLWGRICRLAEPARRMLEAVAVSGGPLRQADAGRCARLEGGDERSALLALRSARLIKSTGPAKADEVETYHDRVREAVVARLSPEVLRDHHRHIALTLEAAGAIDPESLGVHFQGGGEPEKAAAYFALAAARASDALAFDRAATLYRLTLEIRPADESERRALRRRLGDALANSGRGAEAASVYQEAAAGATVADAFELRRLAAAQLLVSGHVEEGLAALREVLAAVGMALPATPASALGSLLIHRARLYLRGLSFRRRDPSEIPSADLARIDVCWSAVAGLSVVDFIRAGGFQKRGLLLALRAGEPVRIARALAMEAAHSASAGSRAAGHTARLLRLADALAADVGQPYAQGMVSLAAGTAAYLEGRWNDARTNCDRAEQTFRDRCTGVAWERATAHSFALWSLSFQGEIAELSRRWPELLKEAGERGDRYFVMNLGTYVMSVVRLAADDASGAREGLHENLARWSQQGYHVQHNDELWAMAQVELYLGRGQEAWELLAARWPDLSRSMLLRVQFIRIAMGHLRARCALAAAVGTGAPGPLLRAAESGARALTREGTAWSRALALLIEAALLAARGDRSGAIARLAEAEAACRLAGMALHAESARHSRGQIMGGPDGDDLLSQSESWMASQGIRNPARMAAMFAPGFDALRHDGGLDAARK